MDKAKIAVSFIGYFHQKICSVKTCRFPKGYFGLSALCHCNVSVVGLYLIFSVYKYVVSIFQMKVHLLELNKRLVEAEEKRDTLKNEINNRLDPAEERENLLMQVCSIQTTNSTFKIILRSNPAAVAAGRGSNHRQCSNLLTGLIIATCISLNPSIGTDSTAVTKPKFLTVASMDG